MHISIDFFLLNNLSVFCIQKIIADKTESKMKKFVAADEISIKNKESGRK